MAIGDDFAIAAGGNITYTGAAHGATGAGYYTTLQFHRWLQDLADDASFAGNDVMDITKDTPSDRSTDNIITLISPYNIDDTASEHLFNGSIIQASGATIYDGLVIIANPDMDLQINQNGAIIVNDFWNSIPFGTGLIGLSPDATNGVSHRFMLKVRTGAADIDGRKIICQTRVFGKSYSEFKINGTARGNNVAALTYATDLNNATAAATVATWTTITNTQGYRSIDVDNNGTPENYYSEWNKDTFTINQFYERMKWLSRTASASTLYGLTGELFRGITHEINVDTPTGTFAAFEAVSWSGGTGQMLAINSVTAATKMWIQLLTGVIPTDNQTITGASTATCLMNVTIVERDIPMKGGTPFIGQSTGSAIIGAYGVGIEALDLSASDKVFDLTNTLRQAPNNVTFTVTNLLSGDRVLVAPSTGSAINTTQMTLSAALVGATVTAVVVTGAIPTDTPATGQIRILRANGLTSRHAYTSWTASTFTIGSTDFSTNNAANGAGVYVGYIDGASTGTTMSFTAVYSADRTLFARVRQGTASPLIKTFNLATATLGSAGGSVAVQRTSDE